MFYWKYDKQSYHGLLYMGIRTAPGLGEGVMPLYWTHLVWDCSTMAFCMYFPLENTSSTDVMLYAHTAERPMFPLRARTEQELAFVCKSNHFLIPHYALVCDR